MRFEVGKFDDKSGQEIKIFDDDNEQISLSLFNLTSRQTELNLLSEQNKFLEEIGGQLKEMNSTFRAEQERDNKSK